MHGPLGGECGGEKGEDDEKCHFKKTELKFGVESGVGGLGFGGWVSGEGGFLKSLGNVRKFPGSSPKLRGMSGAFK